MRKTISASLIMNKKNFVIMLTKKSNKIFNKKLLKYKNNHYNKINKKIIKNNNSKNLIKINKYIIEIK